MPPLRWIPPLLALLVVLTGPSATLGAPDDDPLYTRALQAYRGELTAEEIEELSQQDPAPGLYLSDRTPAERAAARFFGSLPDEAHEELRTRGVLKWRVDRLPKQQRDWIREAVKRLEARREGPFPLEGKDAAYTGFARVRVAGTPQYCWWISSEAAPRPVWVTLVRAIGLLTQAYAEAYAMQLPDLLAAPESEPIDAKRWVRVRTTPARTPPPPAPDPVPGEEYVLAVVRAYRGKLGKDALKELTSADSLLAERLKDRAAPTRALNELFAGLTDAEVRHLLSTGRVGWSADDLTRVRRKLLDTILTDLNTRNAAVSEPYLLSPALSSQTGFAIIRVPGIEEPVISWWVTSPTAAYPAWLPLANRKGVDAPGYFRAHLEQLPAPR